MVRRKDRGGEGKKEGGEKMEGRKQGKYALLFLALLLLSYINFPRCPFPHL